MKDKYFAKILVNSQMTIPKNNTIPNYPPKNKKQEAAAKLSFTTASTYFSSEEPYRLRKLFLKSCKSF